MTVALEMSDVSKEFDGNRALDEAWFRAEYGRVHALLGENGAGKSSLMNVVCGLYAPDTGRIAVDGVPVSIDGPAHARALGIGMVHQHFKLVRPFTVAENVAMANRLGGRWTDELARVAETIERYCGELGFELDPASRIDSISVAERQRVEIVKVLMSGARILILDEPTAVLTDDEADRLLGVVRGLAGRGTAVVLITHKLREVRDFADRVTIMRAGRTVADEDPKTLDDRRMTELMVGSAPRSAVSARSGGGRVRLEIADLSAARDDGVAALAGVTLAVQEGEIYGVAGVGGNGQTELAEVLMGVRPALHGTVSLDGEDRTAAHPGERRRAGSAPCPPTAISTGLPRISPWPRISASPGWPPGVTGAGGSHRRGCAATPRPRSPTSRSRAAGRRRAPASCRAATRRSWCWPASSRAAPASWSRIRRRAGSTCAPARRSRASSWRPGTAAPRCS